MNRSHKGEPRLGLVEYALILVLFLVILVTALVLVGPALGDILRSLTDSLAPA